MNKNQTYFIKEEGSDLYRAMVKHGATREEIEIVLYLEDKYMPIENFKMIRGSRL